MMKMSRAAMTSSSEASGRRRCHHTRGECSMKTAVAAA
jgi:hypothetical protein